MEVSHKYPIPQGSGAIDVTEDMFYSKESFMVPEADKVSLTLPGAGLNPYQEYIDKILLPDGVIKNRAEKLAHQIYEDYKGKDLNIFVIMKGAYQFFTDLFYFLNKIMLYSNQKVNVTSLFFQISSYKNEKSTGKDQIKMPFEEKDVKDKNVLVVEDIYDTGNSLDVMDATLRQFSPKSLKYAIIFHKKNHQNLKYNFQADYLGFFIPDYFVIGYGLDYNQNFRELSHLSIISRKGIDHFRED